MSADQPFVEYTVTPSGILTHVTEPSWSALLADRWPELHPSALSGRPLFSFISGTDVVASCRAFHDALLRGMVDEVPLRCMCDEPTAQCEIPPSCTRPTAARWTSACHTASAPPAGRARWSRSSAACVPG